MSTECYAMIRGSALRVTKLDSCGEVTDPVQFGVSKSVVRVTINEVVEGGGQELLRNDEDEPRLNFTKSDEMIRYTADIDFLRVDPGVLNLVTGVPVVEDVRVISPAAEVTGLPPASWTCTWMPGENFSPTTRLVGPVRNTSRLAEPVRISNAGLVAPFRPEAVATSVYPLPVLSIERLAKVATPLTALAVAVPESVPAPGLAPMASVT